MQVLRSLITLVVLLVLLATGLLLGLDNSAPARLAFLKWQSPELPLFLWVCIALLLGVVLGAGLAGLLGLRDRVARARIQRQLDASRREVRDLRQIALDD